MNGRLYCRPSSSAERARTAWSPPQRGRRHPSPQHPLRRAEPGANQNDNVWSAQPHNGVEWHTVLCLYSKKCHGFCMLWIVKKCLGFDYGSWLTRAIFFRHVRLVLYYNTVYGRLGDSTPLEKIYSTTARIMARDSNGAGEHWRQ